MFEIKRRTLYQDIRELKDKLGMDIRFHKGRNGYYNASPRQELPAFQLTTEEYLLLLTGQQMLVHYGGPSFDPLSFSALQKLAPECFTLSAAISFQDKPPPISLKLFLNLLKACHAKKSLEIATHPNNEERCRKLSPQFLSFQNCQWYLCGHAEDESSVSISLTSITECTGVRDE
jgi:predicted DNA-binding transcriptional regulator YafY